MVLITHQSSDYHSAVSRQHHSCFSNQPVQHPRLGVGKSGQGGVRGGGHSFLGCLSSEAAVTGTQALLL